MLAQIKNRLIDTFGDAVLSANLSQWFFCLSGLRPGMLTPLDLNFFVLLGPRPGTETQTRYVDSTREITTTDTNLTPISWRGMISHGSVIIIMHIYYVLINTLSAHMIQINLDTLFYTHVEHSPTKTIYVKYYIYGNAHTHT